MKTARLYRFVVAIACLVASTGLQAQTGTEETEILRPVVSAYSLTAGGAHVADTYLTPIIYSGWNVGFSYQRMQAMKFSPEKWVMQLNVDVDGGRTLNTVGNATMWNANANIDWAMMRRWTGLVRDFSIGVGGYTGISGGVLYLPRNGNNPASAKASWELGIRAYATYNLKAGKFKALLRWQGSMPLTGIFFSPDYGELYYEIWLGNHSGLVHGAWPGNYRRFNNEVSVDIPCGSVWLRVGYRSEVLSTCVNDITTRVVTNSAVLGITTQWLSVGASQLPGKNARIISALY